MENLIDLRFYLRSGSSGGSFANVPEVLGEHYVHDTSWFHRSITYIERQRDLARVQAQRVRELGLPRWMYLYSLGRHAYAYVPPVLKRVIRRGRGGRRSGTNEDPLSLDQHGDGRRGSDNCCPRPWGSEIADTRSASFRSPRWGRWARAPAPPGVHTESLRCGGGFPTPADSLRLIRLVRAWRPAVLHSHMLHANLMARALRLWPDSGGRCRRSTTSTRADGSAWWGTG